MRYWDTSALVPFLIEEPMSGPFSDLFRRDPDVFTWWGTRVECASAVARRMRSGESTALEAASALRRLEYFVPQWQEIQPTEELRALAEELVARYPLRAGDAFQLASARAIKHRREGGLEVVCFDKQLRSAAEAEGFTVLP